MDSYTIIAVVAISVLGIGAFSQSASAELSGEVNIGLLQPISGGVSNHGEENREAAKLAIIDFNQYLADKGADWSLVMIIEDSQTQPAVALEKVQALHAKGINVMVAGILQNIKGYVDNSDMVAVSCCSTSPLLAIEGDRIFRTSPDDTNQGVALARLMADAGIEIAVPVWREDAWGSELAKSARTAFTNIGGEMADGLGYDPEADKFSVSASLVADQVQSAVDRSDTDKVGVLFMGFGEIAIFMQSAAEYEILPHVQWFGADPHSRDPELLEVPIALQFVTSTEFSTVQVASGKNEFSDRVNEGVKDVLGREPSSYASSTYDAVWLVGLAIEKTQGMDADALTAQIPLIAEEHIGALGSTKLNAAGDLAQTDYDIWHIVDDQWVLRGVYFSATDSITLDAMKDDDDAMKDDDDAMKDDDTATPISDETGGCLIATATYGSELAPQVQFLREIRDSTLFSTASGASFMTGFNHVYYSFSPAIADLERENPVFRDAVLALITPGLYTMNIMTLADPGSEVSVLVFGMLSIGAIAGIYVTGPYLAIRAVCKRVSHRN